MKLSVSSLSGALSLAAVLFLFSAAPFTNAAALQLTPTRAQWQAAAATGSVFLRNGRTSADLPFSYLGKGDGGIDRYRVASLPEAELQLRFGEEGALTTVQVTVVNAGKETLWLEPRLELSLPAGTYEWFDGFEQRTIPQQRESIIGTLPFAAAYSGTSGWALGLSPMEWVSHFRSRFFMEGETPRLEYASRLVVDPGSTETRHFLFFPFTADFGYLNAVSLYQKQFPQRFTRTPGTHPNLAGPTSGTTIWRTQNDTYPGTRTSGYFPQINEAMRWIGGGWEWCYAGFGYRPGDWLCTEELTGDWIVSEKGKPEVKFKVRDHLKKSATEILATHNAAYDRLANLHGAPMMYIIPSYCEWELAEQKYADSIYYTPEGKQVSSGPPWVVKFDRSLGMYSYGNSFGDYTFDAVEKIAARSNIRGFAFDCIDRARQRYTGPGTERSPGRAYDEKLGVYVVTETAHALFGQRVHELKRDGYTLGLTGNFRASSGSYLAASSMDAAIIEHSPWDERPLPGNVRLLMGNKSVSFLHGYAKLPELDKLNAEQTLSMLTSLADYTVLQSLRYAIYPNLLSVIGSPKLIYYSKIFRDLFQNHGWEPVPAAHGNEKLWLSRYGSGAGGILVAGNATPREITGPLEALAPYFDAGAVAFVDYEGRHPVENKVADGKTALPLQLARGEARLFAAALQWEAPFTGVIRGERTAPLGEPLEDTLTFTIPTAGNTPLFTTALPGYRLETVTVNGTSIPFAEKEGTLRFQAPLKKGENRVALRHRPLIGNSAVKTIAETAFLAGEKQEPAFTIVLAREDAKLRYQAERIAAFFSKLDIREPLTRIPTVVKGASVPDGPALFIGSDSDREGTPLAHASRHYAGAELLANGFWIGAIGDTPETTNDAVTLLLETLQPHYPSYGYLAISKGPLPFFATSFKPGEFTKRTGKEYLPWTRTP